MDNTDGIKIVGASEHNLKNIDLFLPRNQFIVVTGLSGSGKSSLVFDTVFAEGQRRFLESMSTYARFFLEQMKRPKVISLQGLQPSIAIDQKTTSLNPRSTVGTVTEGYDYLRLFFSKIGVAHCPIHHLPTKGQDVEQMIYEIEKLPLGTKFYILAPVAQQKKGEFSKELEIWKKMSILKAKIDGQWVDLTLVTKLAKTKPHDIELVIDQLIIKPEKIERLKPSLLKALNLAKGQLFIETSQNERIYFSENAACPECGFSFPALDQRLFSFNSPRGACPTCKGLGTLDFQEEEVADWQGDRKLIRSVRYTATDKKLASAIEEGAVTLKKSTPCPDCGGKRLRKEALNVLIDNKNINDLSTLELGELKNWLFEFKTKNSSNIVVHKILKELIQRLEYLIQVGCGYLTFFRSTDSLSGGELQRLRLASQLGSNLTGVLYVLDEPSIGLHPRDHKKLLGILKNLQDMGNTILVVEHDEETILAADYLIDIGPRAGKHGGEVIAKGTVTEVLAHSESLTAQYLNGQKFVFQNSIHLLLKDQKFLEICGAKGNNLKNISIKVPIGKMTSVTGVSGSGKSTLIMDTLYPTVANHLGIITAGASEQVESVNGMELIDKVVEIDQNPIGRSSRSTPATYIDLMPLIRLVYAAVPEAKVRGYGQGRFSYNVKAGQCPSCSGAGVLKIEMNFLSDVTVNCDECNGKRYNRETLSIKYKEKSISDVLEMTFAEALTFFAAHPLIKRKIETVVKVGLDYLQLGQSATTLSGGEAQRIKLAKELSRKATGKTLYILDEPTTGLHFEDIRLLIILLKELTVQGNTVIIIEHNMDLVASSDWVVELGPEGGNENGGNLIYQGTPFDFILYAPKECASYPYLKNKVKLEL